MKIVIDNDKPEIYYDGDSMGGGFISFPCGVCGATNKKETFYFWKENKNQKNTLIKQFGNLFAISDKDKYSNTLIGLLECSDCNSSHLIHIDYGEISNCHWQSRLHKVLLCNS